MKRIVENHYFNRLQTISWESLTSLFRIPSHFKTPLEVVPVVASLNVGLAVTTSREPARVSAASRAMPAPCFVKRSSDKNRPPHSAFILQVPKNKNLDIWSKKDKKIELMESRAQPIKRVTKKGFTLLELLVVLALVSILGCLLLPALAKTRIPTTRAGCMSNLRQMMIGWILYKEENNDNLIPGNKATEVGWINIACAEGYGAQDGNTNIAAYQATLLAPYINNHLEILRCPADIIPSANGQRIRTYSMNCQMSPPPSFSLPNSPWRSFFRGSDLACPGPQNVFIFADESMSTMNDGWMQLSLNGPMYVDVPANYHDGACGFSFADGHAEIHKWVWPGSDTSGLRNVPNNSAFGYPSGSNWGTSASDVDWIWLTSHSSCKP